VHRHVVAQPLEILRARYEIALAIDLDEHTNLSAGVNVRGHHSFRRRPLRLLLRRRLALLA